MAPATARVSFQDLPDLAAEKVGGSAVAANDEFFAGKENLLKGGRGIFIPDKYTENGKWMDGWETRRKRVPGHDWCIVKLGIPGVIRGVDVDTNHFLGNYPEYCSIEACLTSPDAGEGALQGAKWVEILPKAKLQGGVQNLFPIASEERWSHLRLNIFPDGGVARLKVHGVAKPDLAKLARGKDGVDLAALENGGVVVACNDNFFGPKDNLIMPGRAATMGEGWETRRRRGPGFDWIIVKLGARGTLSRIEVDTNHFKGNFPDSCLIEGCDLSRDYNAADFRDDASVKWEEILPRVKLQAHHRHYYDKELKAAGKAFTHVRLSIFPDGGVSRLRVHGSPA
jgi:allantoicase